MKKLFAMILAVCMLCAAASACGPQAQNASGSVTQSQTGGEPSNGEPQKSVYPLDGSVTLSLTCPEHAHVAAVSQWTDTPFWKAWQEETGVKLEYELLSDLSLLLAGGEYPDIIISSFNSYTGGLDAAVDEGIIVPIDNYMDNYASDYKARLESDPGWMKGAKTPNGHFAGFMHLREIAPGVTNTWGAIIRHDWLNELNREIPRTKDEFVDVLRAFRDEKGATAPLSIDSGNVGSLGTNGVLTSPFGLVSTGLYSRDGVIHHGAYEPEYKEYLMWLNELYEEGLLDKNFLALDSATVASNILNGVSGVAAGWASGSLAAWMTTGTAQDPSYLLAGMPSLSQEDGSKAMFSSLSDQVPGTGAFITSNCKNPDVAAQFLNYAYTEQGNLRMQFGTEGVTYEMVDGKPVYTEFVLQNPDGLPFAQALSQYDYCPDHGPYIQSAEYCLQSYNDLVNTALDVWGDTQAAEHYVPNLAPSISGDEAKEYADIDTETSTFIKESFAAFVTGEKSFDEFDSYLEILRGMGIERQLEIYQAAFDSYNR